MLNHNATLYVNLISNLTAIGHVRISPKGGIPSFLKQFWVFSTSIQKVKRIYWYYIGGEGVKCLRK